MLLNHQGFPAALILSLGSTPESVNSLAELFELDVSKVKNPNNSPFLESKKRN